MSELERLKEEMEEARKGMEFATECFNLAAATYFRAQGYKEEMIPVKVYAEKLDWGECE